MNLLQKQFLECPVCFNYFDSTKTNIYCPKILSCGHTICSQCVGIGCKNSLCPICRSNITSSTTNYIFIDAILSHKKQEEDKKTQDSVINNQKKIIDLAIEEKLIFEKQIKEAKRKHAKKLKKQRYRQNLKLKENNKKLSDLETQLEECHVCHDKFLCPCHQEQHVNAKYRSCAMNNNGKYPQSQLFLKKDLSLILIHICSLKCQKNLPTDMFGNSNFELENDDSEINEKPQQLQDINYLNNIDKNYMMLDTVFKNDVLMKNIQEDYAICKYKQDPYKWEKYMKHVYSYKEPLKSIHLNCDFVRITNKAYSVFNKKLNLLPDSQKEAYFKSDNYFIICARKFKNVINFF